MVDAGDSKSPDSNIVRVQVSPRAPLIVSTGLLIPPPSAPAPVAGVEGHVSQGDDAGQDRERVTHIGDVRGIDEMLLKTWLSGEILERWKIA